MENENIKMLAEFLEKAKFLYTEQTGGSIIFYYRCNQKLKKRNLKIKLKLNYKCKK